MNLDKMDIADLLSDESFINYCKNGRQEDVAFWEAFMADNPQHRLMVENARERFVDLFNALAAADLDEQVEIMERKVSVLDANTVVRLNGVQKDNKVSRFLPRLLKVSAVAAVLLTVALLTFTNKPAVENNVEKKFASACGEKKNIQLPDGSVVMLNAASKIVIDNSYGISARNVYLEGEAFFDVKHNPAAPFIVHTPMMDVKALGTAFNVKAYLNDNFTETSLIRGLVEVTLKDSSNHVMVLHPNEKISWAKHTGTKINNIDSAILQKVETLSLKEGLTRAFKVSDSGSIKEIAWIENKLIFQGETFEEIAKSLGRWYGVKIQFKDDAIRTYRFTGIFEKEDLYTILDFLKESRHFNYTVERGEPLIINLSK